MKEGGLAAEAKKGNPEKGGGPETGKEDQKATHPTVLGVEVVVLNGGSIDGDHAVEVTKGKEGEVVRGRETGAEIENGNDGQGVEGDQSQLQSQGQGVEAEIETTRSQEAGTVG